MKPRALIVVAVLLATQAALRLGALGFLPEMLRLGLALGTLVLLPGAALASLGPLPVGGATFAAMRALGFGIAWNAALVLATRMIGARFTVVLDFAWGSTLALWLFAHWMRSRASAPASAPPAEPRLGGWALALVLAAAGLAALHAGRTGTPLSYYSDSPDHVGTLRRMLETGDAFPRDAFFRDAGPAGADPRKGVWHPQVALIAALAKVDPADAWRQLSAWLAPFFILNLAQLGWLSAGRLGAALFAWTQLLVLAGSLQWFPLRKAVFATFLADELCLAVAITVLADVARPARANRLAAVGLALAAVACHLFSAIQLSLTLGALAVALALRERSIRGPAARALGTAIAVGLAGLPYLLWRARQSYAPANVIHTDPQGLLWLTDSMRIVSIGVLWDWMGTLWILFPLSWWALWRHRRDPAALYALAVSVAVTLVMFDPPVVALLEPRLGYLLMRFIWMVPIGALLGWLLITLGRAVAGWRGRARGLALAALAGVALMLAPWVEDAAATLLDPARFVRADRDESPVRWRDALRWLDREVPAGQVVLSDPATSYGVPMLTRHYVATLVDQHSSPSDSFALTRILDARDALDPYASWERTREVVGRYGATLIVINSDFSRIPPLDFWAPSPSWAAAARARLETQPAAFERLHDARGFTIYRIHPEALDTLSAPPRPRPFVVPYVADRFAIGRRFAADLPVVHRLSLAPARAARGDTLTGVAEWRALAPLPGGCYRVSVRFEQALPGGFHPPAMLAKPGRKLLETFRGEKYRFRNDHLPTDGAYGVDLWRPDEIVRDSFRLVVPGNVAAGYYRTEIRMNRSAHYPNFRLSDYFFDRDYFSGVPMGWIEVVPTRADLARPPAAVPLELEEHH